MQHIYSENPYFNIKLKNLRMGHSEEMQAYFRPPTSWSEKWSPTGPIFERFPVSGAISGLCPAPPCLWRVSVHCEDVGFALQAPTGSARVEAVLVLTIINWGRDKGTDKERWLQVWRMVLRKLKPKSLIQTGEVWTILLWLISKKTE